MVSPARKFAYEVLRRVESGRGFAVDSFQSPKATKLSEKDVRLATELVMGALRAHGDLDRTIEEISGRRLPELDPEIATILRLGIFQIRYLTKIPKSAAVNEAVELAKLARRRSAAGLVNAVLRKCEPGETADRSDEEWTRRAVRSLPSWLAARWERNFGRDGMQALARATLVAPPMALRVANAAGREEVAQRLSVRGIHARPGKFSPVALILDRGASQKTGAKLERSTAAAIEEAGVIQDEASQLVVPLLALEPGLRVLDLCAAPGIKTGQIVQTLATDRSGRSGGKIVAADQSPRRLRTMRGLLAGSLSRGVEVFAVRLDASAELPFGIQFDRILVDAPCSGTGTLARNPEIKLRLVPEDLPRLAQTQERILLNALKVLAPGGRLVYATCSLEPEENDHVIEKALSSERRFRIVRRGERPQLFPESRSVVSEEGFLHTRPDLHGMDGFFAAVIERRT